MYKVISDLEIDGKIVLVRVDYNVKIKKGEVDDDTRIKESLETIKALESSKVVILAHLGRPQELLSEGLSDEEVRARTNLEPVGKHLSALLGKEVKIAPDCVGESVEALISQMKDGEVILLNNLRWYAQESENDIDFSKKLAALGDAYIFDGFGVAHRPHASVVGIMNEMRSAGKPIAAGMLMDREIKLWDDARSRDGYKLLVVGGAKLKEKTKAVKKLHSSVDKILVGGGVYNAIVAGRGIPIGSSLVTEKDKDYTSVGKELNEKASNLLVAQSVIVAKKDYSEIEQISITDGVPEDRMITDIVIDESISTEIGKAQVIMWFGNVGISDLDVGGEFPFAKGTEDFKNAITTDAYVIVGGGDSVTASEGLPNRVISTGGGAAIQYFTTGSLEALDTLKQ